MNYPGLSGGDLGGIRGRLISAPDRRKAIELIDEARANGARLKPACAVLGITARTYQRWTREGSEAVDGRTIAVRPKPAHALTPEEEEAAVALCTCERYLFWSSQNGHPS